jgi:hypothetical protein
VRAVSAGTGEVQYLVLPDAANPHLLARVRWPDVFQAISPVRPDWQDDLGLFDLPHDPTSTRVTRERAATIATEWGAQIPSDDAGTTPTSALIRRMPANWSDLSRAEKRAWSIESMKPAKAATAGGTRSRKLRVAGVGALLGRSRSRHRDIDPELDPSEILLEELIPDFEHPDLDHLDDVIDLTSERDDVLAGGED